MRSGLAISRFFYSATFLFKSSLVQKIKNLTERGFRFEGEEVTSGSVFQKKNSIRRLADTILGCEGADRTPVRQPADMSLRK